VQKDLVFRAVRRSGEVSIPSLVLDQLSYDGVYDAPITRGEEIRRR
jgi:hypothetical protein